jgi:hypothetical protein
MLEYAFVTNSSDVDPVTGASPQPHPATGCAKYRRAKDYLVDLYGQTGYDFLSAGKGIVLLVHVLTGCQCQPGIA